MADIVTASAAVNYLGIASNSANLTILSSIALRVDDILAGLCNRKGDGWLSASHTEALDGNYSDRFVLTYTPIIGTPVITIDGQTVTSTLYTTEASTGICGIKYSDYDLWFNGEEPRMAAPFTHATDPNFGGGFRNVSVTYVGGYGTTHPIPGDLKQAAFEIIGYLWNRRTRDTGLASKTLGDLSWTARDPGAWQNLLDEVQSMYLTDLVRKAVLHT